MSKRFRIQSILRSTFFVAMCAVAVLFVFFYSNHAENRIKSTAQPTNVAKTASESDLSLSSDSMPPQANDVALKNSSAPQHELPESESTTRRKESRAHTKTELSSFISAPSSTLQGVAQYLGQADVPILVDMLNDRRYQKDWGRLSALLARLDEGIEAQSAIIHLIQRGDVWPLFDQALYNLIWVKIGAVIELGRTNGDLAQATARNALTENGALELAREWIERDLPGQFESNPDRVVALIRGRAAMGLVYSLDEESVQLVENLYESVAPRVKKQRERQRQNSLGIYDLTLQEQSLDVLYSQLVDALAMRDLIYDVGYDQVLLYSGDAEAYLRSIGPYLRKYRIDD